MWQYISGIAALVMCVSPVTASNTDLIQIVQDPDDVTVFANHLARFNCHYVGDAVVWLVNVSFIHYIPGAYYYPEPCTTVVCVYWLVFPARVEYNNSRVQCRTKSLSEAFIHLDSANATLRVQDVLGPVGDLKVRNSRDSIFLSWSPPFSLDVTGVDTDIWYTILISDVTDENNPVDVPCTDCHNLTQTHYMFTNENASGASKYSFAVVPQNGAGKGEVNEAVTGVFLYDLINGSENIQFDTKFGAVPSSAMRTPMPTRGMRLSRTTSLINTILIAAGCTLLIISVLLVCGCTALLCCRRRLKEKSTETIEVQNNPLYGVRHRIPTSSNVAYELTQVAVAET